LRQIELPVRVYIEDTDAGGIVYYVNYLKYMERARTEYLRALGFDKQYLLGQDHLFVVQQVTVNYRLPATLDDQLRVVARPARRGRAFIDFEQAVLRGDDNLCDATVRVVCVARATMKPAPFPREIHDALPR